jgi:hypothetical protein
MGLKGLFGTEWRGDPRTDLPAWHGCGIFVTHSFIETILSEGSIANKSEYLRPVDALILFVGSRSCLLVSEWEADKLLALARDRPQKDDATFLAYLAYLRRAADAGGPWPPVLAVPRRKPSQPRNRLRALNRRLARARWPRCSCSRGRPCTRPTAQGRRLEDPFVA